LSIANEVPIVKIDVSPGDAAECGLSSTINNPSLHPSCYDTNTAQHLVTYTVSFGVFGTIPEKDGSGNPCKPKRATALTTQNWPSSCDASLSDGWPQPVADTSTAIDDMNHAAWNGRGEFLSAASPQELITSLQEAIESISSRNPVAAAAVAVDSANVISGGNVVQAKFDSAYWSGELRSFVITTTNGVVSVDTTYSAATWRAHVLLDARDYNTRLAVTYNGDHGIPFEFPSNYQSLSTSTLSQSQINDLLHDAPNAIGTTDATEIAENQAYGQNLVNYLLGDHSLETTATNGIFRKRGGHRLGDIVHSSPVYVGDPDATQRTNDATYQTWANDTTTGAKGRTPMIYVGANDGALHAFNADQSDTTNRGKEVFAYFPHAVFKDDDRWGLHWLANPAYDHNYYVDGEITVAEVYTDLYGGGSPKWNTVLIGTLRGGGRSVFAMDISDPSYFTTEARVAEKILWEFTDDELGYTYGKPTVAKLNNGKWAAIFGNGYNPGAASSGEASLFIKYLEKNSGFEVISSGVGSITNGDCLDVNSNCNGLSTPAVVDLGGDNVADRVYAGDILGNLWAFDLTSATTSAWNVAYSGTPLFQPKSAAGAVQPITAQPMVILHPTERHSNTSPNTMIFFGTGQYITENDPTSTTSNSFYGIWDNGTVISGSRDSVLVDQTVNSSTLAGNDVRLLSNHAVDYTTDRGWYFDLPTSGERVISFPSIIGNVVAYTTIVPDSNVCSTSDGYSWLMVHNLLDGSEPDFIAIDVTGDGNFDSDDQVGDTNVGGVKSGSLYWQMTPAKSGAGSQVTTFIPAEDLDLFNLQGGRSVGTRSSWGRYRME
jgi:type IV pilus assembly protein PilY1